MAKEKKIDGKVQLTYNRVFNDIQKINKAKIRTGKLAVILLYMAALFSLSVPFIFKEPTFFIVCVVSSFFWGTLGFITHSSLKYHGDDMSLPECYEYIAFEDVICDERRAYKKSKGRGQGVRYSKITNPRKENDYLYSFFAFKGLQKYHDYGYVELRAYHPGVRIGDKYILIRDPDTNRIINTYPASKYTLVLNDENLHVMLPEDLTFWEGYKLGITLDDTNSWPFDATVIDMFLDPFINKK